MPNIPQIFRDKIASSQVGTPGVDPSGAMIGQEVAKGAEEVAQPLWEQAIKEQASQDEADYNKLMVQHKTNIMTATEDIKKQYADNPAAAGQAMVDAVHNSITNISQQPMNPRVKLMVNRGEPTAEMWSLRDVYQWSSQQEYQNTVKHAATVIDDSTDRLAKVGSDTSLSVEQMKEAMVPEVSRLASEINAVKASRHPEMAQEIEAKGMKSMYKQLVDQTLETQPQKAFALVHDPEVQKYFTPDELRKYQGDADSAVKSFPTKIMEQNVQRDLAEHPVIVSQVMQGKAGYSEIDAAQRKDTLNFHPETYRYLKDIALGVQPEAAGAAKEQIKAAIYDHASKLGFKLSNDPTKLSERDASNKAIMSSDIKDLYRFQDEVLSAQARGVISKEEAQRFQQDLYIPLVAKTMQKHDPSGWQNLINGAMSMMPLPNLATQLFHRGQPQKVDEINTISKLIDERLLRGHQENSFVNKSAFYDSYFKAASEKLGQINPKTNTKWTPADVMHSVMGEGLGDLRATKFGLRPIVAYDPKSGAPIIETTKEDDAALAGNSAMSALLQSRAAKGSK